MKNIHGFFKGLVAPVTRQFSVDFLDVNDKDFV